MSDYETFRKVRPLWIAGREPEPLAELCGLIGPSEWLFVNAEVTAISVKEARQLRDWLNRALPKEQSKP